MNFGGGYTCQDCGLWVGTGVAHACTGSYPASIQPAPSLVELRVALALERIAAALEAAPRDDQ